MLYFKISSLVKFLFLKYLYAFLAVNDELFNIGLKSLGRVNSSYSITSSIASFVLTNLNNS